LDSKLAQSLAIACTCTACIPVIDFIAAPHHAYDMGIAQGCTSLQTFGEETGFEPVDFVDKGCFKMALELLEIREKEKSDWQEW
jgi:hypothetical protein